MISASFPSGVLPRNGEARLLKLFPVGVVEFVTMPMPFVDAECAVKLAGFRAHRQLAWLRAQPHGAAFLRDFFLFVLESDDRMRRVGIEFGRVRVLEFQNVARKFDRRDLHAQAEAQIRNLFLARVLARPKFFPQCRVRQNRPGPECRPGRMRILSGPDCSISSESILTISTPQSLAMPPWMTAS